MGNPPFVGYKLQTQLQKEDLRPLFGERKNIDYVAGWYMKSTNYIINTNIKCAFVSTNSITQGEQVNAVWEKLIKEKGIIINFAYRTFKWESEAYSKAHVHCVIIGFGIQNNSIKKLYDNEQMKIVTKISPYLIESNNVFIQRRSKPLSECQIMISGSEPRDGGYLLLSPNERNEFINKNPDYLHLIKQFTSADDFINKKIRYCFWLKDIDLNNIRNNSYVMDRLKKCSEFREKSKQKQAQEMSKYPYLFVSERQPDKKYLIIPSVSSENRKYIPIGYLNKDIIVSNTCFTISNASLYTFGILTSNVHMAWTRAVCGRLEMRINYSNAIVYNNFIWPNPTKEQKEKIEQTAQSILDARNLYPNSSLADLYDELTMPSELRKAHQENDKAVMAAYGFNIKITESECVAKLMELYQKKVIEIEEK
jgi:hypothetical protein